MKIKWRCDHEMATKKGIRQICDKKCNQCLCGIYTDEWGREGHRADMPNGCWNFTIRNLTYSVGRKRNDQSR